MIYGDGIDLESVRVHLRGLTDVLDPGQPNTQGFLSVGDWTSATNAIENGDAVPPAAYVTLSRETPAPNRLSSGGSAQNVPAYVSVLFCLGAYRADDRRSDPIETARKAIIRRLVGFTPGGAVKAFRYAGYQLRSEGQGFVWGEVMLVTAWDLRGDA